MGRILKLDFNLLIMDDKIYVVEHLEPRLWYWCFIEYKSISKIVGKDNVIFSNIKNEKDKNKLRDYGKVVNKSVKELKLQNVCLLDPDAKKTLNHKDAKKFKFFMFGGILGDYPPKKRTRDELTKFIKNVEVRNIGKEQLSTDNAVFVVHEIVKGISLSKMKFKKNVEIRINDIETIELPFSYPIVNGKARMSEELIDFIKKKYK